MAVSQETTTLVCLFHHVNQATAALNDLQQAGVPQSSISFIRGDERDGSDQSLAGLGIPARDLKRLQEGLADGGAILSVQAITDHVDTVERIFGQHKASKIDEAVTEEPYVAESLAATSVAEGTTIPIVEEELQVGKRTVDQGGVRVYRRIVEIPAEESINLREEHVVIERNAVDRPATQADLDAQGSRSIELIETAEEAVVGKTAHVVEEVVVGKQASDHVEHIQDTVRRTEVDIEELPGADVSASRKQTH